jgi:hypothetical protein
MAYPNQRSLADKYIFARMADVSSIGIAYTVVTAQGEFIGWRSALHAAVDDSAAITVELNGTAISTAAGTISGAAGAVASVDCQPTPVKDGDVLEFISDGASTNTAPVMFTAIIREL